VQAVSLTIVAAGQDGSGAHAFGKFSPRCHTNRWRLASLYCGRP
jgi:hypothetical protein